MTIEKLLELYTMHLPVLGLNISQTYFVIIARALGSVLGAREETEGLGD